MRMPRSVLLAIVAFFLSPTLSSAQDIVWTIAPYVFASDVTLDATIADQGGLGGTAPFSDLIDKLEGAFMIHAEGRGERFGAFLDFYTVSLEDSAARSTQVGDVDIETDLDLDIIEVAAFYRFGEFAAGSTAFDILAGGRFLDAAQGIVITLPLPPDTVIQRGLDVSESDWMLGGRVMGKWNENWGYRLRADYSGGGTEGVVNLVATVNYMFGKGLFTLDGGWRYMTIELEDNLTADITSDSETTFNGPLVGFVFTF